MNRALIDLHAGKHTSALSVPLYAMSRPNTVATQEYGTE